MAAGATATATVASLPPTPVPVAPAPRPIGDIRGPAVAEALEPSAAPAPAPEAAHQTGIKLNAQRPKTIAELTAATGQGDIEGPDDVKPAAKPQPSDQRMAMLVTPKSQREKAAKASVTDARWSIQVGAYATRQATEAAIKQAIKKVPTILKNAKVVVAALPQKHGTVYRGRLSGLEANDARKACHLLTHCMTVPPGAS
jgi:hypothetical protein